jgi:hypothetical protein
MFIITIKLSPSPSIHQELPFTEEVTGRKVRKLL